MDTTAGSAGSRSGAKPVTRNFSGRAATRQLFCRSRPHSRVASLGAALLDGTGNGRGVGLHNAALAGGCKPAGMEMLEGALAVTSREN
jgi:hypothetical protein